MKLPRTAAPPAPGRGRICFWPAAGLLVGAYLYVAGSLPKVDTLADYRPPIITRVYSDDGTVIAEFSHERRIVVPV